MWIGSAYPKLVRQKNTFFPKKHPEIQHVACGSMVWDVGNGTTNLGSCAYGRFWWVLDGGCIPAFSFKKKKWRKNGKRCRNYWVLRLITLSLLDGLAPCTHPTPKHPGNQCSIKPWVPSIPRHAYDVIPHTFFGKSSGHKKSVPFPTRWVMLTSYYETESGT